MIILDTNVVSEVLRPTPEPTVLKWLEQQPASSIFTTAVTEGEILYGIRLLPEGNRRTKLWTAAEEIFGADFEGRVLSFDSEAAIHYAEIGSSRRTAGRPISQFDAIIAAITRSHGAALATRNVRDFEGCGIEVLNPWNE
ncbi:MAG: type II toxin-antitoxin system VapC family toxin [Steroidobacteraceae bacterium]